MSESPYDAMSLSNPLLVTGDIIVILNIKIFSW